MMQCNFTGAFKKLIAALLVTTLACGATPVLAAFPDHPVRLIVAQPAGGPADATGRIIAQKLSEIWKVPVVVENRAGADMQIGNAVVARAAPDGYTLLLVSVTFTMGRGLYPTLPYDSIRDFAPVSGVVTAPLLLVTADSNPARTVAELLAQAKSNPGKQTYASVSALNFVGGEMFKKAAGIEALHVPYKGSAASVIAVSTGEATWTLDSLATVRPMVEGKRLRVLAVTSQSRMTQLPEVPTLMEAGVKDFALTSWFGIMAPGATPPALIKSINADVQAALAMPETQQKLHDIGGAALRGNVESFSAFVTAEFARFEALIKANGLQANR